VIANNAAPHIGIKVDMLGKYYAPFVPELRDRIPITLDIGTGLETVEPTIGATKTLLETILRRAWTLCLVLLSIIPETRQRALNSWQELVV
jgi:hypothetical protein